MWLSLRNYFLSKWAGLIIVIGLENRVWRLPKTLLVISFSLGRKCVGSAIITGATFFLNSKTCLVHVSYPFLVHGAMNHVYKSENVWVNVWSCAGFVWFVLSLVKKYYLRQFSLFAWTHVALLIVVTQSYLIIQNLFQGTDTIQYVNHFESITAPLTAYPSYYNTTIVQFLENKIFYLVCLALHRIQK